MFYDGCLLSDLRASVVAQPASGGSHARYCQWLVRLLPTSFNRRTTGDVPFCWMEIGELAIWAREMVGCLGLCWVFELKKPPIAQPSAPSAGWQFESTSSQVQVKTDRQDEQNYRLRTPLRALTATPATPNPEHGSIRGYMYCRVPYHIHNIFTGGPCPLQLVPKQVVLLLPLHE